MLDDDPLAPIYLFGYRFYLSIYLFICLFMNLCVHKGIYTFICKYLCIRVYIYMHIHTYAAALTQGTCTWTMRAMAEPAWEVRAFPGRGLGVAGLRDLEKGECILSVAHPNWPYTVGAPIKIF